MLTHKHEMNCSKNQQQKLFRKCTLTVSSCIMDLLFMDPAHSTWPWQVLTQGFSARTRASWCVQFCVWHAVHSVNVCWMHFLRDVSYWFVLYLKKEGCSGKEHLVKAEGLIWRKIYYFGRKVCWQNTVRQKSLSSTPPWVSYMSVTLSWIFFH